MLIAAHPAHTHSPHSQAGCERAQLQPCHAARLMLSGLRTHKRSWSHLPHAASSEPGLQGVSKKGDERGARRRQQDLCESGLPDVEACNVWEDEEDSDEPGPVEMLRRATPGVAAEAYSRGKWLLGLLILQSTSSLVLDQYQQLLKDHLVVTLFLTMLVGAGGNAGNQSAIKVIRGLATKTLDTSSGCISRTLAEQSLVGVLLATGLSAGGFVRVYVTNWSVLDALAISSSLFFIVLTSVTVGAGLPFALAKTGVDPANAGTSIQVVMDIVGCLVTCLTCNLLLHQLAGVLPFS